MRDFLRNLLPKNFLWRLTLLNIIVIAGAILLSGWAIYQTACFLVVDISNFSLMRQQQFNTTLFQYVFIFTIIAVFFSSLIHYYFTKKLTNPVNKLIESTKVLKAGKYPKPIEQHSNDEIGTLITNYNELINQLQKNDEHRKKLIDDLSHELRTPVANITGYLHALQSGTIAGDSQLYTALYKQALQLSSLMDQLGQLHELEGVSSLHHARKTKVQLKELIDQSIHMFNWKIAEKGLSVNVRVEEAVVYVDKKGIQQVLNNLIDNALRYNKNSDSIVITGNKDKEHYYLAVTNEGDPITQEAQSRLFERFYRMEPSRNRETGGTGLGLAIAKEIVENHHGTISVQSKAGKNTFIVTIPLVENLD